MNMIGHHNEGVEIDVVVYIRKAIPNIAHDGALFALVHHAIAHNTESPSSPMRVYRDIVVAGVAVVIAFEANGFSVSYWFHSHDCEGLDVLVDVDIDIEATF